MRGLADLTRRLILSIVVGVDGSLGEKYSKQHGQSYGRHPGHVSSGFSPTSHYFSHLIPTSDLDATAAPE
ncbi:MAG TPA: hypothetical protein VED66_04760 [Candidatus Sulfotelmatobacter sp.]|nr:hypothetical protein [Candidatus Sulfotelmatobacter sp.]